MNRKKFYGLIFMMLLSIIGIIWIQIVWIKNAIGVRNENFNNAVIASLNNAANAIESSRRINFFNNFMIHDPFMFNGAPDNIADYLGIGNNSSDNDAFSIRIESSSKISGNDTTNSKVSQFISNGDTINIPDSGSFVVKSDGSGEFQIIKSEDVGRKSDAIYMKQNEFLDWVKKRSREFQNMSRQMISEIFRWETDFNVDSDEINNALNRSLQFAGIRTPFEYALIKNGVVQNGNFTKSGKDDFMKSKYMVSLFPDNIIRQDLTLSVIFPNQTNYVLGSMAWILGGSLIFSLFILATFALSLYFIINQKKISEIKSDFINNMTHEFKTPIATISLAADTIANPKVINSEDSIRHFVGMIKKENSRMNKKVETIFQIASLDKKEIEFKFENVSIHSIIERVVETIDIQVQQRDGRILLHLDAENPVIYGDSEHLGNLVNNLLDNALKYSPESPEIIVETKNIDKGIIFSVEDKGIGMSKSVQSKIFERFYRQNSGNIHDIKGFGLGLNYAKAIVDAHMGTISIASEPGKGSRFNIFLPFNWEA